MQNRTAFLALLKLFYGKISKKTYYTKGEDLARGVTLWEKIVKKKVEQEYY